MKFFCDQCNAQYMIADEKVGPRGVKVKCKKCSHVILVKPILAGDATTIDRSPLEDGASRPAEPTVSPAATASKGDITNAFDSLFSGDEKPAGEANAWSSQPTTITQSPLSGAARVNEGEKEWYVAIDDSQVGPITMGEVAQRWDAREVSEETLAWKAGLPDWVPIADIPELSHLVRDRPQKRAGASGAGVASGAASPAAAAASPAAAKAAAPIEWKPSAASALSSLVQEELSAAAAPKESGQARPPEGTPDLGLPKYGTNDLFGGQVATPSAASGAPPSDSFAGGAAWSVPSPRKESGGKGLYVGLGLLFLVVVGGFAFFGYVLLTKQNAPPPQVAMAPQQHPAAPPPTAPPQATPIPTPAPTPQQAQQAAPEPKAASHEDEDDGEGKGGRRSKKGKEHKKERDHESGGGGGGGHSVAAEAPPPADAAPPKASLSKDDIWSVVRHNAAKAGPCLKAARGRNEFPAGSYTFILDWTIAPSGAVSAAQLKGPAGVLASSLPQCFASVVSQWRFPASQAGAPIHNFPFGPVNVP